MHAFEQKGTQNLAPIKKFYCLFAPRTKTYIGSTIINLVTKTCCTLVSGLKRKVHTWALTSWCFILELSPPGVSPMYNIQVLVQTIEWKARILKIMKFFSFKGLHKAAQTTKHSTNNLSNLNAWNSSMIARRTRSLYKPMTSQPVSLSSASGLYLVSSPILTHHWPGTWVLSCERQGETLQRWTSQPWAVFPTNPHYIGLSLGLPKKVKAMNILYMYTHTKFRVWYVHWLLACVSTTTIMTLSTASREWALYGAALYRKCLKYLSCSPRSYVDPTLLPRNQWSTLYPSALSGE